jgi:hypothetical protein
MPTASRVRVASRVEDLRVPDGKRMFEGPLERVIGMLASRGITLVVAPCSACDDEVLGLGDVLLPSAEVGPMMRRLRRVGLEVTAFRGALNGEEDERVRLGFLAHGRPARLAGALHAALGEAPRMITAPLDL